MSSDPSSSSPPASGPLSSSTLGSTPARRRHREQHADYAYTIQRDAALKGMLFWTFLGGSTIFLSHHLFPAFRRQTLAFKGFLTSAFTIWGLCTGAEKVLQDHENEQRAGENLIRDRARSELGKIGRVASEMEIEKWTKEQREALLQKVQKGRETNTQ